MKVSLIDIDSKIPNLALMKLSAWHKAQGHEVILNSGKADTIYASCVFSWNKHKLDGLMNSMNIIVGGSGVDLTKTLPDEVERMKPDYLLYQERYPEWQGIGFGFLSRGCSRKCKFCIVPQKEGNARVVSSLDDLINPDWKMKWKRPFIVMLDNNFLSLGQWTLDTLDEMTKKGYDICFSQGLDIRLVTPEIAEKLAMVSFWNLKHTCRQVTFAFDDISLESIFRNGISTLLEAGIKKYQIQSFVLCGFNSTLEEDLYRIDVLRSLGVDPFAMVYRDPNGGRDRILKHFARWVNKRLYRVCEFKDYSRWQRMSKQELLPL